MKDWNPKSAPYRPGQGQAPALPQADSPLESISQVDHWAFLLGIKMHDLGYHWEAHEVWESLWHLQSGASKEFLKILIQLTAAHLKFNLGEFDAAERLGSSLSEKLKELSRDHKTICGFPLKTLGLQIHQWLSEPNESRQRLQLNSLQQRA